MNIKAKILFFSAFVSLNVFFSDQSNLNAQVVDPSEIVNMSTGDLESLVNQARAKGYTEEQIKAFAKTKGLTASQISELQKRLEGNTVKSEMEEDAMAVVDSSYTNPQNNNTSNSANLSDPLFGFNFFNNPKISFEPNLNLPTPSNYRLGPGDGISISLWGAAENNYNLSVNKNGVISIPNIGPVNVNGLNFDKASEKIESKLLKVYGGIAAPSSSPYKIFTDVSLSKVRSVQVNIIGQVKVPGTYSLSALSTLLNALYVCGGPTRQGTFREIKLIRDGQQIAEFDIYKYLIEGSQAGNKTIQDQDVIIVGSYISRIYVEGEVKRPGIYEIKSSENFQDLMNYVSGFTSTAYKEKIKLVRIDGDRKILKEIDYANAMSEPLVDGDIISVGSILGGIKNRVSITGSVYRPGDFEFTEGLTVKGLIERASGLTSTAYKKRGILTRTVDGVSNIMTSFSVEEVMNSDKDISLQPGDVVQIFNQNVVTQNGTISISGAVKNPISIPFVEGITLEELVVIANGYTKTADTEVIDVTREVIDEDYTTINKILKISTNGSLDISNNTSFEFQPNDRIVVRSLKGSYDQQYAIVKGEVNYPGTYYAEQKNERILDLLNRAGGLSPYAYQEGATLIRLNPFYKEKAQTIASSSMNEDNSTKQMNLDLNNKEEFNLGIDLKKLLVEGENSKHNLVLKNGDRLIIPSVKETIKVEGQVMYPNLVPYDDTTSLKNYISESGGFTVNAKRGKTYVIYPNGDIATTKKFLFFKSYPKVTPGSLILVPEKVERKRRLNTQEIIGVSTGLTTLALLIERLFSTN